MIRKSHLIEQIKSDIENRILIAGDRMPSVRELCKKYGCSHMTAYNALLDLVAEGIIENRPRSGHYVNNIVNQDDGHIYQEPNISNLLSHLIETESHEDIHPLGTAAKLDMLLPIRELLEAIPYRSKENFYRKNLSTYSYPPGDIDLRRNISKHLSNRNIKRLAEEIILTNGATESLYLSLRLLTSPGDTVIISAPCFFGTINILEQLQLKVIEIPSIRNRGIDIHSIKNTIQNNKNIKVGIFQTNFDSPTGELTNDKTKEELVKFFKSKSLYLIEDDTYGDLCFSNNNLSNLKSFDTDNSTVFSCSSFSKTLGTGLRVGWVIPPSKFIELIKKQKLASSYSGNTFNEKMIKNYLKTQRSYQRHLKNLTKTLKSNIDFVRELCQEYMPEGTYISNPLGGYCLWLEFPEKLDSFVLYKRLIKNNIAVSPGLIFSTKNDYKNCIRINCAIEIDERMKRSIRTIGKLAKELI
jgi:DNA-binding transcriptional MocR family regulator